MRHLGSIMLAALVAPLLLVLVGRGVGGYLEAVADPPVDPVAAAFAVAALGLAGLLYALLTLARFAPLGPVLAGLGYLALGGWLLADPAGLLATVPGEMVGLTDPQLTLSAAIAPLLALPLLVTMFSGRRWRGSDPAPPPGPYAPDGAPLRTTQEFAAPAADWPPVPTGYPPTHPGYQPAEPYGAGPAYGGAGYPRGPVTGYGDYPSGAYPGVTTRLAAAGGGSGHSPGSEPTVPSVYGNEPPTPPAAYGYLPPQRHGNSSPLPPAAPLPAPPGAVSRPATVVATERPEVAEATAVDEPPTVALRPGQHGSKDRSPEPRRSPEEETTAVVSAPPTDPVIAAPAETAEPIPIGEPAPATRPRRPPTPPP